MAGKELFVFNPQFDVPGFVAAASPMIRELPPAATTSEKLLALLRAPHPQAQEAAKKLLCFVMADPRNAEAVRERGVAAELADLLEHPSLGPVAASAIDVAAASSDANRVALAALAPRLLAALRPSAAARSVHAGANVVASLVACQDSRDAVVRAGGLRAVVDAAGRIARPAPGSDEAAALRSCVVALGKAASSGSLDAVSQAGGLRALLALARTPSSRVVDEALAVVLSATSSPQGRAAIVAAGGHTELAALLGETDAPVALQRALKTLSNLCVDDSGAAAVRSIPVVFEHVFDLMSAVAVDSPLLVITGHFLSNALRDGVSDIVRRAGAIETLVSIFVKTKDPVLRESVATILGNLMCETENLDGCVEEGVPKLLVSHANPATPQRLLLEVLRGLVNGTSSYEPFRKAVMDAGGIRALQGLLDQQVPQEVRMQAIQVFRNLALSLNKAQEFKNRPLIEALNQTFLTGELPLKTLSLLLFANLSMHDVVRPMVVNVVTIQRVANLLAAGDRGLRAASLKVLTNFTHEGRVRKWFSEHPAERALLERQSDTDLAGSANSVLANLAFSFDKSYPPESDDSVDASVALAKLQAKQMQRPVVAAPTFVASRALTESAKREAEEQRRADEARRKEREEEQRHALEEARLEAELARERAEKEARKLERQRQEETARKAAEEKKRQEEESRRAAEERARLEAEAAARKRAEEEARAAAQEQDARKQREQQQKAQELEAQRRQAEQLRIEEERRRAEEEQRLRKKAEREEARRRHQEHLRLQREKAEAEENARRIAEEEAKLRVLEEERRLAEEQARRVQQEAKSKQEEAEAEAEARRKKEQRRTNITREIYDTEKSYLFGLRHVVMNFQHPLMELCGTRAEIVPRAAVKAIFSNLEVICNFNSVLVEQLSTRLQDWSEKTLIGDAFCSMVPYFRSYVEYVNNYENAITTLGKLRKEVPALSKFIEAAEAARLDLPLSSVLIFPIQRVPRYILLLTDLLRFTPEDHPDHKNLEKALGEMRITCNHINECKRDAENIAKLYEVQAQLRGAPQTLLAPNRRFITDSPFILYKSPLHIGKNARFFLFNDLIVITRPMGKNMFKWKGSIHLTKAVVLPVPKEFRHAERCMKLQNPVPETKGERPDWILLFPTAEERDKLGKQIEEHKEDVLRRRQSLRLEK